MDDCISGVALIGDIAGDIDWTSFAARVDEARDCDNNHRLAGWNE